MTNELEKRGTVEKVMEFLFEDMGYQIYDTIETRFSCNCSRERVEKAVISIGKKEIQEMIDEDKPIEVNCHFCNKKYTFSVQDLKDMMAAGGRQLKIIVCCRGQMVYQMFAKRILKENTGCL